MLSLVLQQLISLNNECIHQMKPDDMESLRKVLFVFQQALSILRNKAHSRDTSARATNAAGDECPWKQSDTEMDGTHSLQLLTPVQYGSFEQVRPVVETYCVYETPFLLRINHVTDLCDAECEEEAMNVISATLLFNFSVLCHQYGIKQAKLSASASLLTAAKLYKVLIGLLHGFINAAVVEGKHNELEESYYDYFLLLLSIAYSNLGLLYFELQMYEECDMFMTKLSELLLKQSNVTEKCRISGFYEVILEVTMNVKVWMLCAPSPVAVAA